MTHAPNESHQHLIGIRIASQERVNLIRLQHDDVLTGRAKSGASGDFEQPQQQVGFSPEKNPPVCKEPFARNVVTITHNGSHAAKISRCFFLLRRIHGS